MIAVFLNDNKVIVREDRPTASGKVHTQVLSLRRRPLHKRWRISGVTTGASDPIVGHLSKLLGMSPSLKMAGLNGGSSQISDSYVSPTMGTSQKRSRFDRNCVRQRHRNVR